MATEKQRRTLGYAGLGLFIGILLFAFVYNILWRTGIAERYTWMWVFIHLAVLLGPAVLMALVGAGKKSPAMV